MSTEQELLFAKLVYLCKQRELDPAELLTDLTRAINLMRLKIIQKLALDYLLDNSVIQTTSVQDCAIVLGVVSDKLWLLQDETFPQGDAHERSKNEQP